MASYQVDDVVTVSMPKGPNKRGVMGIHVLFATSQEARFDGATGTVTEVNPRGPYGSPLYLVDFRGHKNRTAVPWQAHWFRGEWLKLISRPAAAGEGTDAPARSPEVSQAGTS